MDAVTHATTTINYTIDRLDQYISYAERYLRLNDNEPLANELKQLKELRVGLEYQLTSLLLHNNEDEYKSKKRELETA